RLPNNWRSGVFSRITRCVQNEGDAPQLKQTAQLMALAIKYCGIKLGKVGQGNSGLLGHYNLSALCLEHPGEGAGDKPAPLNDQDHASIKAGRMNHCRMQITPPHQCLSTPCVCIY